jgi:S1-C subfamily serine protease
MRPSTASLARLLLLASLIGAAARTPAQDPATETPPGGMGAVERSVVKVFSTIRAPDPLKPWAKQAPAEHYGSGVVIEGHRILTNAHLVLYASQVQVQAHQAGDKVSATVEAIAPGIDLAVLRLDDASFFDTRPPLQRAAAIPDLKDTVLAYGYPAGGTNLSISKGIVSRIEFAPYNFPVSGLRIQIDAAINPGNSGGPAVVGDRMIGLAFSTLGGAQNIGYIIPNEEIDLFLAGITDGRYRGKPALYDALQTLENPALRAFLKIGKDVDGIVVSDPYGGERPGGLRRWDVITSIGGTPVDDQGMVQVGPNLRIRFRYMVQRTARNGKVSLTVVRAGKALTLEVPVSADRPVMVPDLRGAYPPYFVYGPVVFSPASLQLVQAAKGVLSGYHGVGSPLFGRANKGPAFPGEELVVVASPLLPHKLGKGYGNPQGEVVRAVNGVDVKNLRHLVELLRDARDEFVVIDFLRTGSESLVFVRKQTETATDEILTDGGIRAQGSAELMAVWGSRG